MIRNKKPYDPNYRAIHTHSPISVKFTDDITYSISKEGRVKIEVNDGQEFDEVEVPASLIFRIADALNVTRSTELVRRDEVKKDE